MKVGIIAGSSFKAIGCESLLRSYDYLIAADAGANHCRRLNLVPDVIIGDFDSIDSGVYEFFKTKSELIEHPQKKDNTDFELALSLACERGATEVHIFYWCDERFDYSFDALLSASELELPAIFHEQFFDVYVLNSFDGVFELKNLHPHQKLSVYGLTHPVSLQTKGLRWELSWSMLSSGARSQSNEVLSSIVQFEVGHGSVFGLVERLKH